MARPSEDIEYNASVLKGKEPSHANIDIGYRHREEQLQRCWPAVVHIILAGFLLLVVMKCG